MVRRAEPRGTTPGRDEGFALIAVVLLTFLITVVGLALYAVAGYEVRQAQYQRDCAQAFWAAETGLDRTVNYLTSRTTVLKTYEKKYSNEPVGNGSYSVEITPDPANSFRAEKRFTLRATGCARNAVRILEEVVLMECFARYGYFTNAEQSSAPGSPVIWFYTGDDVGGKIHTNGTFHIAGTPRFRGAVTSVSDHMVAYPNTNVYGPSGWPSGSNNPAFDQGFTLGVPAIPLPADTGDLLKAAQAGGLSLTGNYELQFGRTTPGTVSYRPIGATSWVDLSLSSLSTHVIHVTGTVQVQGVLDGTVTLGATQNIELIGDMRYAAADATTGQPTSSCDDMMGMVAGQNILVKNVAATQGDMIIDSTVMALNTSFTVENYDQGTPRGTLHIWGGLIQDKRGPVGTFDKTSLKTGYLKDYHYDNRVTIEPPPEFPQTGTYARVSWTERGPAA